MSSSMKSAILFGMLAVFSLSLLGCKSMQPLDESNMEGTVIHRYESEHQRVWWTQTDRNYYRYYTDSDGATATTWMPIWEGPFDFEEAEGRAKAIRQPIVDILKKASE